MLSYCCDSCYGERDTNRWGMCDFINLYLKRQGLINVRIAAEMEAAIESVWDDKTTYDAIFICNLSSVGDKRRFDFCISQYYFHGGELTNLRLDE